MNSPGSIVNILHTYYVNVAVDIGPTDVLSQGETMEEINRVYGLNPSVQYIRTNLRKSESFMFSSVNESEICQKLKKLVMLSQCLKSGRPSNVTDKYVY